MGEGDGGRVGGDSVVGAEQGVPLFAREGGPLGEKFGVLGGVPGGAVVDVGEPGDGVVAAVAEDVEGGLQSCLVGNMERFISAQVGRPFSWSLK